MATLEMARTHLVAVNGASEATAVRDIPPEHIEQLIVNDNGAALRYVPGIEQAMRTCVQRHALPSEIGLP